MPSMLSRWIDATIPAELRAPQEVRSRARLVQVLCGFGILGLLVAGITRYSGGGQIYWSHAVSLALFLGGSLVLRLSKSLRAAAASVLATGHFALVANTLELGGWVAVMTWDGVLLAGAVYLLGTRAGWVVAGVTICSVFPLAYVSDRGWIAQPTPDFRQLEIAVMVTNQLVLMMLFTRLYARENQRLHASLEVAAREAEASNRAKSVFLATMSHEIRTPMNGVIASADLLRRHDIGPEERALATMVYDSGHQLLTLLNDILDFSKFEAGEVKLERIPFNLVDCASGVLQLQAAAADRKGVQLDLEVDPLAPEHVTGDAARLRQVLLNLVSNAVKFTESGRVVLSVSSSPGGLLFAVEDTGIGISVAQRAHLFKPFSQADASVHRTHGGTGLGLAISQRIVQAMGGEIEIESHGERDRGSRFYFEVELPVVAPSFAPPPRAEPSDHFPSIEGSILIVDDNDINRRITEKMLERLGCASVSVEDGAQAVQAVEQTRFALVLMDRQMPGVDGIEATQRIRALGGEPSEVPILGLTASAFSEEITECLHAGMQDVLTKPITIKELERALSRWATPRPDANDFAAPQRS